MYRFTADEQHLLVMDCLGLTRLSPPAKVKTDRAFTAGDQGHLSISADGTAALAYRHGWCSTARFDFPSLKKVQSYERFDLPHGAISPDGTRAIHTNSFTIDDWLEVSDLDGRRQSRVHIPRLPAAGEVTLGETDSEILHLSPNFTVSPDLSFYLAPWRGPIHYGHLDPETLAPRIAQKIHLRSPENTLHRAWPDAQGITVAAFFPRSQTCSQRRAWRQHRSSRARTCWRIHTSRLVT